MNAGPFFYRLRLVRGAAYSAVKVWYGYPIDPDTDETLTERPAMWRCEINGLPDSIDAVMVEMDGDTGRPVIKGDLVSEIDYRLVMERVQWATTHAPNHPDASVRKPLDMNLLPPIKFERTTNV
jgi:hypothetical protein